ncbi:MAG: (Fe-S)-binding protein [Anaerolineales bacterium]|nr:(Fe-S)-binding protein [Anaerolineales bacterium]
MAETVQLFVTCLIDGLFPQVGEAVVEVLTRAGLQVEFPADQTCCGQPAFNAGYHPEARRMAKHTIEVFEKTVGPIIIPSGSCAAMVKHHYVDLFAAEPEWKARAEALAERTFELSQFLVDELGLTQFGATHDGKVAYHPSCHLLRDMKIERQPLALLEQIDGLEVEPLEAECCGFGGVFAVDHAEVSAEMLGRKMENIAQTGADTVVACDVSCLMHIEGGLRKQGSSVRCVHLAQLLAGENGGLR